MDTLKRKGLNLIPNALLDPAWKDNSAAVDMNIIAYVGLPIDHPDGGQFGTVCFLNNKQNAHNDLHIRLGGRSSAGSSRPFSWYMSAVLRKGDRTATSNWR